MNSTFLIAEVGSVHDGSLGNALSLVDAAAACGVDAVKFQTHLPEAETLSDAPTPSFFRGESRFEYFRRTGFDRDEWCSIRNRCRERGVEFMSSPFSEEAVELLEEVGVERYKIPSGEVTNLPMLDSIARLGKPILLSSGMNSWGEIDAAVARIRAHHDLLTVLQCTSAYPCPYGRVGLNVMLEMGKRYEVPFGLSDHTLTNYASFAAVTLGATVIERHFTFSRLMYGSDARHSLEPSQLKDLVEGVRAIETMQRSKVDKDDLAPFGEMKRVFEKSLVAEVDIEAGQILSRKMIGIKKPGNGLPAARLEEVLGKRAARSIVAGSLLSGEDIHLRD